MLGLAGVASYYAATVLNRHVNPDALVLTFAALIVVAAAAITKPLPTREAAAAAAHASGVSCTAFTSPSRLMGGAKRPGGPWPCSFDQPEALRGESRGRADITGQAVSDLTSPRHAAPIRGMVTGGYKPGNGRSTRPTRDRRGPRAVRPRRSGPPPRPRCRRSPSGTAVAAEAATLVAGDRGDPVARQAAGATPSSV